MLFTYMINILTLRAREASEHYHGHPGEAKNECTPGQNRWDETGGPPGFLYSDLGETSRTSTGQREVTCLQAKCILLL